MRRKTTVVVFSFTALAVAATLLHPRLAGAQGNDFSAPTGGRSTLMGGTGVALGRDGAAPFLNPAGIVRIEDQRLAFSVNFYTLGFTSYSKFHQPGTVDNAQFGSSPNAGGVTTNTFRVLPSTLCLFFTLRDLEQIASPNSTPIAADRAKRSKLAICFAALESVDDNLQAVHFQGGTSAGPTATVSSFSGQWNRSYIGPTYSTYLSDRLAIGASANGVYSHDTFSISANSITSRLAGGPLGTNLGISGTGSSLDLTAIVGATYRLSDTTTLGLSIRAPSLHVLGSYNGAYSNSTESSAAGTQTVTSGTGSYSAPSPPRIAAGVGFEWQRVKMEADLALEVPIASAASSTVDVSTTALTSTGLQQTSGSESYAIQSHMTANPSIGLEYFVSPAFSVLGGLGLNLSMLNTLTPQPSVGNLIQTRTNQATASFGIGSYGDRKELLFGTQLRYGWGDALAVNPYVSPNDWAVVSTQSFAFMVVISGATDLRSIENAVIRVENVVETGNPSNPKRPVKPEKPDPRDAPADSGITGRPDSPKPHGSPPEVPAASDTKPPAPADDTKPPQVPANDTKVPPAP